MLQKVGIIESAKQNMLTCLVGSSKRREEPMSCDGNGNPGSSFLYLFILCLPELPKSKKRRILDSDEEEASATTSTSR